MKKLYQRIKDRNSIWKFKILQPYLYDKEKILDFGCGDMGLTRQIALHFREVYITGADVIPLKKTKNNRVSFVQYDGRKLPFADSSFDTVIAFYVLHHCGNPLEAISECVRVSKKRILIVESIPHNKLELPFMRFIDWFFNILKFDNTPLPYKFYTLIDWNKIFQRFKLHNTISYHPKSYEDFFPFGKMYVLEFRK